MKISKFISFIVFWLFTFVVRGFMLEFKIPEIVSDIFDFDLTNITKINFDSDGNDFQGFLLLLSYDFLTGNNLELSSGNIVECENQLQGFYYNPLIGNTLLPIDHYSLNKFDENNLNYYSGLSFTGGLYYNCGDDYIYGQIEYNMSGQKLFDASGNVYYGTGQRNFINAGLELNQMKKGYFMKFEQNLKIKNGRPYGIIYDDYAGVGYFENKYPDKFVFMAKKGMELTELVMSNEIEIKGLSKDMEVLAQINKGSMYVNGDYVGKSFYVENGDKIKIEIIASEKYESVVSSTLNVAGRYSTFYVTTRPDDYDVDELPINKKLAVLDLFKEMIVIYENDLDKLESYLYTMKSMIEDRLLVTSSRIDKLTLEYLLELIDTYLLSYIPDQRNEDLNKYVAPNCKIYFIEYDIERQAYYSPDFKNIHYFMTEDDLKDFVDYYNKGDGNCEDVLSVEKRGEDEYIAPNGKVYRIEYEDGSYYSPDFIKMKYFDSLATMYRYIDINNPMEKYWDHILDVDFDPLDYKAPNGKVYKIQKTNKGFMSYRFLSIKYFDTIDKIKKHIDKYNTL